MLIDRLIGTRIYGEDAYRQIGSCEPLTGKFNSSTARKLLVNVDEATFGGFKERANRLKGIITKPVTSLEAKGKDSIQVQSHINLIFTSNED